MNKSILLLLCVVLLASFTTAQNQNVELTRQQHQQLLHMGIQRFTPHAYCNENLCRVAIRWEQWGGRPEYRFKYNKSYSYSIPLGSFEPTTGVLPTFVPTILTTQALEQNISATINTIIVPRILDGSLQRQPTITRRQLNTNTYTPTERRS